MLCLRETRHRSPEHIPVSHVSLDTGAVAEGWLQSALVQSALSYTNVST